MLVCPVCHAQSPSTLEVCECGYRFSDGTRGTDEFLEYQLKYIHPGNAARIAGIFGAVYVAISFPFQLLALRSIPGFFSLFFATIAVLVSTVAAYCGAHLYNKIAQTNPFTLRFRRRGGNPKP